MTVTPPPLDYSNPSTNPSPEGSWGSFVAGAIAGVIFSAAYYLILMKLSWMPGLPYASFGAVTAKVVVGIRLLKVPRWRRFGIGLLVSIPLAILIFVGLCFAVIITVSDSHH